MRTILALLGIAVLVVVVLLFTGMINLNAKSGSLPTISVQGGKAPSVDADVAKVTLGSENKTVEVPTIDVQKPANAQ